MNGRLAALWVLIWIFLHLANVNCNSAPTSSKRSATLTLHPLWSTMQTDLPSFLLKLSHDTAAMFKGYGTILKNWRQVQWNWRRVESGLVGLVKGILKWTIEILCAFQWILDFMQQFLSAVRNTTCADSAEIDLLFAKTEELKTFLDDGNRTGLISNLTDLYRTEKLWLNHTHSCDVGLVMKATMASLNTQVSAFLNLFQDVTIGVLKIIQDCIGETSLYEPDGDVVKLLTLLKLKLADLDKHDGLMEIAVKFITKLECLIEHGLQGPTPSTTRKKRSPETAENPPERIRRVRRSISPEKKKVYEAIKRERGF
ncbi:uncharacterized protein LOC106161867 [Lingula anatina]|uniref:Uncharacterized protein LOC106161867 n=1 Tax=Lingula anatina TaxID=7574 RepID=A0A1S3I807_LINAN|nr:uncharacterized protein LOC106161867 [Lingula anatina]|eukprot:XP_013394392.1 uncharacterized protein LOC106161867 [Lingula anatina]